MAARRSRCGNRPTTTRSPGAARPQPGCRGGTTASPRPPSAGCSPPCSSASARTTPSSPPVWITGPGPRRQEALDAELAFYRERSAAGEDVTTREWLQQAITHLASLPSTAALVDSHAALYLLSPSGDAAEKLVAFWRQRDQAGALRHDLADPTLSTRFLGDLYQDLSDHAKSTYALLQTPVFVEEFILDRTLEPALRERPLEGFRMIDPTCGSGHFLLGAFERLLDRWNREAPGLEQQARVQEALNAVHGVDLNPFAVAITRFRLTVAALRACGETSLKDVPAFRFHVAAGDSLLHGSAQLRLKLGLGDGVDDDVEAGVGGFVYATEDLALLRTILTPGTYDAVVGNPPYITVKDKTLNLEYRKRYDTCKGTYALTVPFMQRFFELAKPTASDHPAGWVGQITSNSFMKREFGSKLIEQFLVGKDLRLVADTSGAYIPGHGTPTVILVGRQQRPAGDTVRAVLGVRGEPGRPDDPAKGLVWSSIVGHVDEPGWADAWLTIVDLPRDSLATHPWRLGGGESAAVQSRLEGGASLDQRVKAIGYTGQTNSDEAFLTSTDVARRNLILTNDYRPFLTGEKVRDYLAEPVTIGLFPYCQGELQPLNARSSLGRWLWPMRTSLGNRATFVGSTYFSEGRPWWSWHQVAKTRLSGPVLTWSFVATHNHFVYLPDCVLHNRSAPMVQLPGGATEDEHLALLGLLNSSTACFWLKQNSHGKGNGGVNEGFRGDDWEEFWEFTGTTLQDYPLPATLPLNLGRRLDGLAQRLASFGPTQVSAEQVPTATVLGAAQREAGAIRAQMVAVQEELDWDVYGIYGFLASDGDLTYDGKDLPGLSLGERAFEIALARKVAAGDEQTAWFVRHGSTPIIEIPEHWPEAYRALVQRRLNLIASDPLIRLLEKPEHKRRWAGESWDKRQERALRGWLLERLEDQRFWFDAQGRPTPRTIAQLADDVARAPDLVRVLALWEGRPDVPLTQSLVRLLADEAVPYLAAHRYKDTGLRKREAWEHTWALQRREDAGEKLTTPIPVPPKYVEADFRKLSYWQARGKLDVPKERFILYPDAGRETDPTPLLGWAGWDHAQQALALNLVIAAREDDGWTEDRLVPLVAGLAELQPWVQQWHDAIDPDFDVNLADYYAEQLTQRAAQVGSSLVELAAWRPAKPTRGRKTKTN